MTAHPVPDVASIVAAVEKPSKAVVTAGMPYANGPLHLGHLAGAQLPADIYARWMGMVIGRDNVLFVSGSDEHGSTSELASLQANLPVRDFIDAVHDAQESTLRRYSIGLDVYSGTSRPDCFPLHKELCQEFLRRLHGKGLLEKRTSSQWFDPKVNRFLPDRLVRGRCPNPNCDNESAYSDQCDVCGRQFEPSDLLDPRSALTDASPVLKDTVHWYLDMWAVAETLREWIQSKEKSWRKSVVAEVLDKVLPSLRFDREHEDAYTQNRASLPRHKLKYTSGKRLVLQFEKRSDLELARGALAGIGVDAELVDEWAHRSITRDTSWGVPVPDLDPDLAGKTLYVWPDSLIAPISFSQVALRNKGLEIDRYSEFWRDPGARITQFLGQDNVFFYVLMEGALWLGMNDDVRRLPHPGELQLPDIVGAFHLLVSGEKMSKSRGNFITANQLLDEHGYTADQVRYYLALLSLAERSSDFDFVKFGERNKFLAGPMNAAFERPISAAHSKFGGRVPQGTLSEKVVADTRRIVQRYVRSMHRIDYPNLLFEIENYARTVNSLFTQYKPHDDRYPEDSRRDALYSSFYVLKNLMIMLYPFVPTTMERLRESLRLSPEVFRIDQLGTPIEAGHEIGQKQEYFPPVGD